MEQTLLRNGCLPIAGDPVFESRAFWLENLRKYKTLEELRRSAFFAQYGSVIDQFLVTPQTVLLSKVAPRLDSFVRVAQWNIEKGKRFKEILHQLETNDVLRWADIIILNEADQGMNRSQNRHVARDLAEKLGMHMAFGPTHFELTKGTDDELELEGSNSESLQGNAILTRFPILEACVVALPMSFEPYEFEEKRFGRRICLWVRLQMKKSTLWVGSVHLELRNTPSCRARQIIHVMKNLPGGETGSFLLGGDLNTNSFGRGTAWRTVRSVSRLLLSSPRTMKNRLLHPENGIEPLFRILNRHGFTWKGFNSSEETARAAIDSLEEVGFIPAPLLKVFKKRLEPYGGFLCLKLDWLLGNNVRALASGQRGDLRTGVVSLQASCVSGENAGPNRLSDHLPIYADLDLA